MGAQNFQKDESLGFGETEAPLQNHEGLKVKEPRGAFRRSRLSVTRSHEPIKSWHYIVGKLLTLSVTYSLCGSKLADTIIIFSRSAQMN